MRLPVRLLCLVVLATLAVAVHAQGPDAPPSVIAHPDMLARELDVRANADRICWTREAPRAVDWLAERDPSYRRGEFSRYHLSELEDGWRWVRRDASYGPDLRSSGAVEGVPYTDLEVHGLHEPTGWAVYEIDSELASGRARFEWTLPPASLCMADGLALEASAAILEGNPGARNVQFVLPLTAEQQQIEGPEVKACSPNATTGVDGEIEFRRDAGRCVRDLYHLDPASAWAVWVRLPESFFVIYNYVPNGAKK